jgi:hypothetical protein
MSSSPCRSRRRKRSTNWRRSPTTSSAFRRRHFSGRSGCTTSTSTRLRTTKSWPCWMPHEKLPADPTSASPAHLRTIGSSASGGMERRYAPGESGPCVTHHRRRAARKQRRRASDTARDHPGVRPDRPAVLRRTGGADRADAPRAGRGPQVDLRRPVPACAELLHDAAGTGGAAARHLYRLAPARHTRRPDRRHPVRPPRLPGDPGALGRLRAVPGHRLAGQPVLRAQGGDPRRRDRGGHPRRPAGAGHARPYGDGGGGVHRPLRVPGAVPGHHPGGRADWMGGIALAARTVRRDIPRIVTEATSTTPPSGDWRKRPAPPPREPCGWS